MCANLIFDSSACFFISFGRTKHCGTLNVQRKDKKREMDAANRVAANENGQNWIFVNEDEKEPIGNEGHSHVR
jgi:hypothetical protein